MTDFSMKNHMDEQYKEREITFSYGSAVSYMYV